MPRRSLRSSSAVSTPQKRSAPATPATSTRQTKRSKATNSSNTKSKQDSKPLARSKYVEDTSDLDSFASSPSVSGEESGYEDEDHLTSQTSSSEDDEDEYGSEDSLPKKDSKRASGESRKNRSGGNTQAKTPTKNSVNGTKGKELWRPGVKAGLGAGTEVVIAKPKARSPGNIPYSDKTIHPNTMLFLGELAENNERSWLKLHDPDYRASLNDFNSFIESLQEKIISVDDTIPELPVKDIAFRIYRDIRFTTDPTPYKTHFSAAWSRTGRKGPFAAYYVQIKPGGSYIGGGLWMPEAGHLAKLRRDIDRKPHKIKLVLHDPTLRRNFLEGVADNEKKVIKAFAQKNNESALKTKPKGYDADHKNIELLRLRSFTLGRKLKDEEVVGPEAIQTLASYFESMVPFITYLNSVVMPDDPDDSSSDEDEDEGDDNGDNDEMGDTEDDA